MLFAWLWYSASPKVTSYDWGERRVKTLNGWDIELSMMAILN